VIDGVLAVLGSAVFVLFVWVLTDYRKSVFQDRQ
jgi:hypothetical protein